MQGSRSPVLSDHGSLSCNEGDDDELPLHRHDDFDDNEDEDEEDDDYDRYNHQFTLLHRSKPNLSFNEKIRGRASFK